MRINYTKGAAAWKTYQIILVFNEDFDDMQQRTVLVSAARV